MSNKVGRRPRRGTPMPNTAITAAVEELVFLMLMGDGTISQGIQRSISRLVDSDPESAARMRQVVEIRDRAVKVLGEDATQKQLYSYITANYWELAADDRGDIEN